MAQKIDIERAMRDLDEENAVLVCAYDDEEKCRKAWIDGALTLHDLEAELPLMPREQEIIFYCA